MNATEIIDVVKEVYKQAGPGETLYAWGWDYPSCPDPRRDILDEAFPENPVVLIQFSGHGIWVNSRVQQKYRIGSKTPDPEGGRTVRDEQDNTWFPSTVGLLNRYRMQGRLTTRVSCWFYGMMPFVASVMRLKRSDGSWIARGLWKYLLDGTFSTRTAWLLQPYAGEPENFGIETGVLEKMERFLELFRCRGSAPSDRARPVNSS